MTADEAHRKKLKFSRRTAGAPAANQEINHAVKFRRAEKDISDICLCEGVKNGLEQLIVSADSRAGILPFAGEYRLIVIIRMSLLLTVEIIYAVSRSEIRADISVRTQHNVFACSGIQILRVSVSLS